MLGFKTLCQHSLWWTTSKGLKYCFEPLVLCSGCDQEYGAHQRFPHSPGHHFVLKPLVAPHESNTWCSWWYSRKVLCGKPSSILEQRGYLCQRGVHMKYQATTTTPPRFATCCHSGRYSSWPGKIMKQDIQSGRPLSIKYVHLKGVPGSHWMWALPWPPWLHSRS